MVVVYQTNSTNSILPLSVLSFLSVTFHVTFKPKPKLP